MIEYVPKRKKSVKKVKNEKKIVPRTRKNVIGREGGCCRRMKKKKKQ